MAIPADRNVVQKEAEKMLKYKSLCIEIQRMWNLKCTIIPVITLGNKISLFFVPQGKISNPNRAFNAEFKY